MIAEALIAGSTIVGCAACWVVVAKQRILADMQKVKLAHDLEVLKPPVEPIPPKEPTVAQKAFDAKKKALDALLERRKTLEVHINGLRSHAADMRWTDKSYNQWRADMLKALDDARAEQQELVLEETGLLESMHGGKDDVVPTQKPLQSDPGGFMARRVEDPRELHDVELHDEETSRKGAA